MIVHRALVGGSAHHALVARSSAGDLLVTGARRRHVHLGPQLGLMKHTVLHHSDCPVAVVPQQGGHRLTAGGHQTSLSHFSCAEGQLSASASRGAIAGPPADASA